MASRYSNPLRRLNPNPPQASDTGPGTGSDDWWTANAPPGGSAATGASPSSGNPGEAAVRAAFAKKGLTPSPDDVAYWVGKINETGGWQNPGNQKYWLDRMANPTSGVGTVGVGGGGGGGGAFAGAPGGPVGPGAGFAGGAFGGPGGPGFQGLAPYQAPGFSAPTGLNYMNDPGFQERLKMGTDAIQASAAAKGSILSGGTLKALERYAQDYASNEFGNVYNRALGTAAYNQGVGQQGYQNRYGQYQDYQGWLNQAANRGLQAAQTGYQPPRG